MFPNFFSLWTKYDANFHLQEKVILPFFKAISGRIWDLESIQWAYLLISSVFPMPPPPVKTRWYFLQMLGCSLFLMYSVLPVRPPLTDSWDGTSELWFIHFTCCCNVGLGRQVKRTVEYCGGITWNHKSRFTQKSEIDFDLQSDEVRFQNVSHPSPLPNRQPPPPSL